jgi:hypothetical protein
MPIEVMAGAGAGSARPIRRSFGDPRTEPAVGGGAAAEANTSAYNLVGFRPDWLSRRRRDLDNPALHRAGFLRWVDHRSACIDAPPARPLRRQAGPALRRPPDGVEGCIGSCAIRPLAIAAWINSPGESSSTATSRRPAGVRCSALYRRRRARDFGY